MAFLHGSIGPEGLNEEIRTIAGSDWCHRYEFDHACDVLPAENLRYRLEVYGHLFSSLFKRQKVLVLNEASGLYPVLISKAGAAEVVANNPRRQRADLMRKVGEFTGVSFTIIPRALIAFDHPRILVEQSRVENFNYLFVQNGIWGLFNSAGQNFSDVVEACSHYVTDGLVFDWNNAAWANPAPPDHYNRGNFHDALSERFEFVLAGNDWLTVALGKLPLEDHREADSG